MPRNNTRLLRPSHRERIALLFALGVILLLTGGFVALYVVNGESERSTTFSGDSIRAIDSANTITDRQWFDKAYAEGFRLYILHSTSWGTCDKWYMTEPQLGMAVAAGLKIAVYTRDPRCWREGIQATGPYATQLQFFALDIETKPGIAVTREMVDGVTSMGVRPVIYTGSGMWDDVQANGEKDFSDIALWDTDVSTFDYSSWTANYMQPRPVVYGGWNTPSTMRVGVQQQFEYELNGIKVDLNSFRADFLK